MKRYALGIHHLNIAYCSGNIASYHRQVRESIIPFLNLLNSHTTWCFSIELCGSSLEFIGRYYPAVIDNLRNLIDGGQVELISVTYSPQIWIAFPQSDLLKSIAINQRVLEKYRLRSSRIFFTQENFSGTGIKTLKDWFDIVVVKDDYYYHFHDYPEPLSSLPPYYKVGELKLMVGWGHILEAFSSALCDKIPAQTLNGHEYEILTEHYDLIVNAANRSKSSVFADFTAKKDNVEWFWYHIGSSERFSKPLIHPENYITCKYSGAWCNQTENLLLGYEQAGYKISGIQSYLDEVSVTYTEAGTSKELIDGAWNMAMSTGAYIWMGLNEKPHEDALGIRNHNWLSRSRLIAVECLIQLLDIRQEENDQLIDEIEETWKSQLLAESSDATGWFPERSEVLDSICHSESVLNSVAGIVSRLRPRYFTGTIRVNTKEKRIESIPVLPALELIDKEDLLCTEPRFYGGQSTFHYYKNNQSQQLIVVDFIPEDRECGLIIKRSIKELIYSPALMDNSSICIDPDKIKPDNVYLALPNGLFGIGEDIYLIKHNEFMNIAACFNRDDLTVDFKITNHPKRNTRWKLTIFKGELTVALDLAIAINIYPSVYL